MKTGMTLALWLFGPLGGSAALAQSGSGEHLLIYAAAAVKNALTEIAADYEAQTGHTVTVVFDTAGATERNFLADARAALLITSHSRIERATREGALGDGTTTVLGMTVAGIAVPPGSPKPDVSSADSLRAALLAADRIAFSDPGRGATVGTHFAGVIESLGVREAVMAKATLATNGLETMRLVLEEGVDIGITQTVEILQASREAYAGPFPEAFELATAYSLWHRNDLSGPVADFVAQLLAPAGRERIAADGLRPPDAP